MIIIQVVFHMHTTVPPLNSAAKLTSWACMIDILQSHSPFTLPSSHSAIGHWIAAANAALDTSLGSVCNIRNITLALPPSTPLMQQCRHQQLYPNNSINVIVKRRVTQSPHKTMNAEALYQGTLTRKKKANTAIALKNACRSLDNKRE